jgi:hypothetical protein
MTTVYKIVRVVDGKMYSVDVSAYATDHPFCVEYKKGETAFPPEACPKSKLMAFSELDWAIRFLDWYGRPYAPVDQYQIWEAQTRKAVEAPSWICSNLDLYDWYWDGKMDVLNDWIFSTHAGTVFCDDITLIRRVE